MHKLLNNTNYTLFHLEYVLYDLFSIHEWSRMICHIQQCPKLRKKCFETPFNTTYAHLTLLWIKWANSEIIFIIYPQFAEKYQNSIFLFRESSFYHKRHNSVSKHRHTLKVFLCAHSPKVPLNNLLQNWEDYWWLILRTHGAPALILQFSKKKKKKKKGRPFAKFKFFLHKPNFSRSFEHDRTECVCVCVSVAQ